MASSPEYYIGIENPNSVRRLILETLRETMILLQKYEKINIIRAKKEKYVEQMNLIMTEIYSLLFKLREMCPDVGLRYKESREIKTPEKTLELVKPDPNLSNELHSLRKEIENLDEQLKAIKVR